MLAKYNTENKSKQLGGANENQNNNNNNNNNRNGANGANGANGGNEEEEEEDEDEEEEEEEDDEEEDNEGNNKKPEEQKTNPSQSINNTLTNAELNEKIKELSKNSPINNIPNTISPTSLSPNNNGNNNVIVNTNVNNTSKNPVVQKFIEFVNSYANIDKIDDKIIAIVNTAFKKSDQYDANNSNEKDFRIKEDKMAEFCKKNANNNSMIPITLNDPRLSGYIKIYKEMKNIYIDNCEYLLRILETKILDKTPVDEKDENPHFTIKNIGYSDLVSIETDVRNKLITMYSGCHEKYQMGMVALFNALKPEEQE